MESEKITKTVYDPEEVVYSIHHSSIPRGTTQCLKHEWVKESFNEIKCKNCPTIAIINPNDMNKYVG